MGVSMNTVESETRLRHRPAVSAGTSAPSSPHTLAVPIVVLSTDAALCQAISAAAEPQRAEIAASLDEAIALAAAGRCGILVTDQALSQSSLVRISKQVRAHDPAIITIAVGGRGDDNALIGLLSSAVVERFMLKPVTPALARSVLKSAATEYRSLKSRTRSDALLKEHLPHADVVKAEVSPAPAPAKVTVAAHVGLLPAANEAPVFVEPFPAAAPADAMPRQLLGAGPEVPPPRSYLPWMAAAAAALFAVAITWWVMQQRMPDIDPQQVIATNLRSAQEAASAGRYAEPSENSALHHYSTVLALDPTNEQARAGVQQVVEHLLDEVKTLIVDGRLAEAGIALERIRRISADQRRVALLDEQLRREQTRQLALLQERTAPPAPIQTAAVAPKRMSKPEPRQPKPEPVLPASWPAPEKALEPRAEKVAYASRETEMPVAASVPVAYAPPADDVPIPAMSAAALAPTPSASGSSGAVAAIPSASNPPSANTGQAGTSVPTNAPPAEPKLIDVVQPQYPDEARMRGLQGWVDLTLSVNAAGQVIDARVDSSSKKRVFDRAALSAVRKWRYEAQPLAAGKSAHAVRVRMQFQLKEE